MKRHDEVASVARQLYERSGRIEGRDVENWHEAERIVTARYRAEEKTPDRNSEVKVVAEKTVKKAEKEPAVDGEAMRNAVSLLRKSQPQSRARERA